MTKPQLRRLRCSKRNTWVRHERRWNLWGILGQISGTGNKISDGENKQKTVLFARKYDDKQSKRPGKT